MKAIQIKYLPCTDTKGVRLKVSAEGVKSKIYARGYANEPADQAREAALDFVKLNNWGDKLHGFGQLPNGDWVATLGE